MGLIGKILGIGASVDQIGGAVERVAEVFVPNRTKSDAFTYRKSKASLDQFAAEFKLAPASPFESFVNGLNRMPRPTLAFGTVGLFAYAMSDPVGFSVRMQGLDTVPDQLWWLLGAIVSFYFGARELHYKRQAGNARNVPTLSPKFIAPDDNPDNAAFAEWQQLQE
jgi:hypothetical protein